VTELTNILQHTQPLRLFPEFEVEVAEAYDDTWYAAFTAIEHAGELLNEARRGILQRISAATAFAQLRVDGEPAAVVLGVLEEDWVGVYCLATAPGHRRRGAASALLRTLAIWAQLYAARYAYLQVMEENQAAQALYRRTGFTTLYHYHYREQGIRSSA
jgi:ribosomal protein S18 acetylase RimI-like enzyme